MADDYDFQIDTLKFRAAVSDKFPYVRGTAPFRKEQFDSSGRAGDQSLTGWWTRGQFSFHKGLGIKYYEVSDGDEVLDRAAGAHQVYLWEPGEVTLDGDTDAGSGVHQDVSDATVAAQTVFSTVGTSPGPWKLYSGNTELISGLVGTFAAQVSRLPDETILYTDGHEIRTVSPFATPPATGTLLWTNDDMAVGVYYSGLFVAKSRIWAFSDQGHLYVLPFAGGTVASGGPEMHHDFAITSDNWSLASAPGGIFISEGQFIWAIDVDDTTGALTTPRIVADLGVGTDIQSILFTRGRLAICTGEYFAVAAVDESNSLTLGPPFIRYASSLCRFMATANSKVYFLAVPPEHADTDSNSLYEVNMADEVSALQPTWTIRYDALKTGVTTTFALEDIGGTIAVVANGSGTVNEFHQQNPGFLNGTTTWGWVETGQHRMGTLELKKFQTLRVTAEVATGNWIDVYVLGGDGGESLIRAIESSGQTDIDLSLVDAAESIGFRFELWWTAGGAPTKLLGYQLKALPVPERQRLLRWPLAMADVLRLRGGTEVGRKGRAYEALTELEALESSSAVVSFTDHRTGETGTAYIDQVEFQGDTPANRNGGNFGGIAYVTLRVIG